MRTKPAADEQIIVDSSNTDGEQRDSRLTHFVLGNVGDSANEIDLREKDSLGNRHS